MKKIIIIALIVFSIFFIYLNTMDKKVYYLALGDSIAAGVNAGAVSVCVMSGETTEEILKSFDIQPDYVFPSVIELGNYLKQTRGR